MCIIKGMNTSKTVETSNAKREIEMKVTNAIKKLEKAGYTVKQNGHQFTAENGSLRVIEFCKNGSDSDLVTCIRIRAKCDRDDVMTDYCAGTWCDNISQAIRIG